MRECYTALWTLVRGISRRVCDVPSIRWSLANALLAWGFGDVFSIICEIQLGNDDTEEFPVDEIPFPGLIEVAWHK